MIKRAPSGLKKPGKKFWKKVLSEYELTETHDLERLNQAAGCLDVIDESEKDIEAEGFFILDRFKQKREHPGLKVIRDNKTLFCRIIRDLCLDLDNPEDSRPPRSY